MNAEALKFYGGIFVLACWIIAFGSLFGIDAFNYEVFRASLPIAWLVVGVTVVAGGIFFFLRR